MDMLVVGEVVVVAVAVAVVVAVAIGVLFEPSLFKTKSN